MASPLSPRGSVKRHARNISYPRRPTVGPLDAVDDPLAETPSQPQLSRVQSIESAAPPSTSEPETENLELPDVDLSFLQDATIFHQVPTDDVPAAFQASDKQPQADTSLPDLLQNGHFRLAANVAASALMQCRSNDARAILELLYTRLACLLLISRPDLAAAEASPLTEFLARHEPGVQDILPLVPWELRLLLVRLQSLVASDGGRRAVMALYSLATEVRTHIQRAIDDKAENEFATWTRRLHDLGLRVADAFVEIGELDTATRHLDTLVDIDKDEIAYRKALLRLRMGDVVDAQRLVERLKNTSKQASLAALIEAAEGNFAEAANAWEANTKADPNSTLDASNLALGLVYTGRIQAAEIVLEDQVKTSPAPSSLLFNLATIYELRTEQAFQRKMALVEVLAARAPTLHSGGWERAAIDFKL